LDDMRADAARVWRVVDLGTGGGDIPRWLVREARRAGLRLTVRAIERDARAARFAREMCASFPEITVVEADACDPASWGGPDYAFAQHFLHHLPDDACRRLLADLTRETSRGFVVSDLRRSRLAHALYRVATLPVRKGSFIASDGLLSIQRGFTVEELCDLSPRSAPAVALTVSRAWPFRVTVVGRKGRFARSSGTVSGEQ
jgi:SAM-dependent methyltransferase